jgi:RNA polymerase sigma factor (sigma-70 family)
VSSDDGLVLGAPAEPEPLGELVASVLGLASQAAALVTADEVDARLRRIVVKAARPAEEAAPAGRAVAVPALAAAAAGIPHGAAGGVGVVMLAAAEIPAIRGGEAGGAPDADRAVTALYRAHYRSLVRLAALLVPDLAAAQQLVQDSFVALPGSRRWLRDSDQALSYLRQVVVTRSRGWRPDRVAADRDVPASARAAAMAQPERSAVVAALRTLPRHQREAVVLRYYGNLSEAQAAGAMGVSQRAARNHAARAMTALRAVLDREG